MNTEIATSVATGLATLGGGCFWCLEAALLQLKGVESVVSGYAGGSTEKPDYRRLTRVCKMLSTVLIVCALA